MSFNGITRYFHADAGQSAPDHSKQLEHLQNFRLGGIIKVKTQDKEVFVNTTIYHEAVKLLAVGEYRTQLSNGLLVTRDDLSRITNAWERLINPDSLKRLFLSFSPSHLEKLFNAIQEVEDHDINFDDCKIKLSALGCPDSIMDICITALTLAKPAGYKINREMKSEVAKALEIVGN